MTRDSGNRGRKNKMKKVQKTFGKIKKLLNFATPFATEQNKRRKRKGKFKKDNANRLYSKALRKRQTGSKTCEQIKP